MFQEVNIIGGAHVRVVQMNHTHSGASKYSCLQAKYMSKWMRNQQLYHGLCNQMGMSQHMGTVQQYQMLKIQVQNPSEQSQPSAQIIVCSNINGLLIYHWGSTSWHVISSFSLTPLGADFKGLYCFTQNSPQTAEELKTNLMSLVIFISLVICSTCFEH